MVRIGLIAMGLVWVGCLDAPPGQQVAGDSDAAVGGTSDGGSGEHDAAPNLDAGPMAEYDCEGVDVGPVVDGTEDSIWMDANKVSMTSSNAGYLEERDTGYQRTFALEFRCLHDDDTIYFWFDVLDGANAGEVVEDGPELREDDGVVLFLDAAGDRLGPYGSDDHAFVFGATDAAVVDFGNPSYMPPTSGDLSAPSYAIETGLAKSALSGLAANGLLGFNVALIDDDSYGDNLADMFALWSMPLSQVPQPCNDGQPFVWCNTTGFTTLLLR